MFPMDPQVKGALLTILVWVCIIIAVVLGLQALDFSFRDLFD